MAGGKKRGAGAASRVRSAITGRFLKKGSEKRNPSKTVVERIKPRKKK
jgi:hypothetical protein